MIGIGPMDKWEHDLEKMSRAALVALVTDLHFRLHLYHPIFDRDAMTKLTDEAKQHGRWLNSHARYQKFKADPDKAIAQSIRRSKAAKKAARRNKRRVA